jgi:hypothetical protein
MASFMASASIHRAGRRFLAVVLFFASFFLPVKGAEVVIPLTVPFDFLTLGMGKQLNNAPGDVAVMRYDKDCRYLYLDHPQFGRQGQFVRFVGHGRGSAGTEIFGTCLNPISWRGFIEILATPSITPDWQLHLRIEHSNLYDENWQKGLLMGPIWEAVQYFVLPSLTSFSINLTPPRDEVLSLLHEFVPVSGTAQLDAVFRSATAKAIKVNDRGVNVDLALTLPDSVKQAGIPSTVPEAPLSPEELAAVQQALEQWDAFLVFVVKDIGMDIVDPDIRAQLLELLLASRYEVLPILAGESSALAGDPVRTLFIETWIRLQEIIRMAEQKGIVLNNVVRYAAFIRAGDVLLTIDRAAPGLGLEITADGLRRLARILQPELKIDPLQYNLAPDPVLRELFGFPAELPEEEPLEPIPEDAVSPQSLFSVVGSAYAVEHRQSSDLAALRKRLNRWVPSDSEITEYRATMNKLLLITTERELQGPHLETRYKPLFRNLVRATALKESCWRQFTRKREKTTYLRSSAGSIGLMQVNPYVWRGFYNVEQLRWNVHYNAEAGTEILLRYLLRYAVNEEKTGSIDNIARSAYAVYNAGPGAASRYRKKSSSKREKKVDLRFWEIYRGFKANGEADLFRCTVG